MSEAHRACSSCGTIDGLVFIEYDSKPGADPPLARCSRFVTIDGVIIAVCSKKHVALDEGYFGEEFFTGQLEVDHPVRRIGIPARHVLTNRRRRSTLVGAAILR
jgi:hypothetical protein